MTQMQQAELHVEFDEDEVETPEVIDNNDAEEAEDQTEEAPEGSESSTDNTAKEPEVKFSEEQQRVFNQAISKKVAKTHDAERKAQKLERELQEMKARHPQNSRPTVPPAPDPLSLTHDEYMAKIAERDAALGKASQFDFQQQYVQRQEQEAVHARQRAAQEQMDNSVTSYMSTATKLGVKAEELQQAGHTVGDYFDDNSPIVEFILQDDVGPLITKYLGNNIAELETLSGMSPVQAAVRIATIVKPKALALKTKVNSAPDPIAKPTPSGSSPQRRGPQGASYE